MIHGNIATGYKDLVDIMPKYMKLPIRGFRNKNFHCFVTTDHFLELLNQQGAIKIAITGLLVERLITHNALLHSVNPSNFITGDSDLENDSIFLLSLLNHNKAVATVILPRMNYLFSVHFFGVQPVFGGRGLTEYRNEKVNSFVNSVHRILTPYEYIMFNHPVHAVADGTIVSIENSFTDNLFRPYEVNFGAIKPDEYIGNTIEIAHSTLAHSIYGNLKRSSMIVKVGDKVKAGQEIARVGMSGKHPSPYLFFAMSTPGVKIPIAGNIKVGFWAAHGMWDTHFEYDLFNLGTPLTDDRRTEDFYNYIRTDQIKYTFAPSRLRDGTLVKQYPTIDAE